MFVLMGGNFGFNDGLFLRLERGDLVFVLFEGSMNKFGVKVYINKGICLIMILKLFDIFLFFD